MIIYRAAVPADIPFVYATFLHGLRFGNARFKRMTKAQFYKAYHDKLTTILADPDTTVTLACLQDDPNEILGYSVTAPDTLHCIYVKKVFRHSGIGQNLLPYPLKRVSFTTDAFSNVLKEYGVKVEEPK